MHDLLLCDSVTICCCQEDTDLRIPVAFLKNLPALFSRNLWPPHQKYSRISLKVFFKSLVLKNRNFIIWQEKKKRNFHIAKSCAILWLWQFLHGPPCRYFPRIILKLLLFWFLWGLRSLTCRCLLIFFFVVNCCRKLSLWRFFAHGVDEQKKNHNTGQGSEEHLDATILK